MNEMNSQVGGAATLVMMPKSALDEITQGITDLKTLIEGRAKDTAASYWVESTEARKQLGVSEKTWQNYRARRVLPFSQFGRKIYVKQADIDAFLEAHKIS